MGRKMQAYLILGRSLRQRKIGPKRTEDCVADLFGLLSDEQCACLEQGILPSEESLKYLAGQLAKGVESIRQELENFVFWAKASPQIR